MPLNLSAQSLTSPAFAYRYDHTNLALYALSACATPEQELELLYERNNGVLAMPTFAVIAALAPVEWLQEKMGATQHRMLHGGQRIRLYEPLPASGELTTTGRVVGIYDLARMAQSVIHTESRNSHGRVVAETEWTFFHPGEGRFNGDAPPRQDTHRPPQRTVDAQVTIATSKAQAALYRLNGDFNPLHIDPLTANQAGYDRPILHGLCTLAVSVIALGRAGVPLHRVSYVEASFRATVFPGDTILTELWRSDRDVWFQSRDANTNRGYAVRHGYAQLGFDS